MQRIGDDVCECAAPTRGAVRNRARLRARRALLEPRRAGRRAAVRARRNRAARAARAGAPRSRSPTARRGLGTELDLQMTYGLALKTGRGYAVPEVGAAYARARELCRQVEDPARVVPVLIGLVGAPRRRRRDHHLARRRARDAPAVRAARRSEPADDRATGRSARRCSTSAICGQPTRTCGAGSSSTIRRSTGRASGRPASSRASSAAASSRAR